MKRLGILFFYIFLFCTLSYGQEKIKIAVLDFPTKKGLSKAKAADITDKLMAELSEVENFSVAGKEEIKNTKLLKKKMSPGRYSDLGNALNADYIIWSEVLQMYEAYNHIRISGITQDDTIRSEAFRFTDKYLVKTYLVDTKDGSVRFLVKDTVNGKNFEEIVLTQPSKIKEKIITKPKDVVILSNVLYVYPEDIEKIEITLLEKICDDLNKKKMYGFDDWRPPTLEEMQMIQLDARRVKGLKSDYYFLDDCISVFDLYNSEKIQIRTGTGYRLSDEILWSLTSEGERIGYFHYLRPVRGGVIPEN